MLKRLLAVAGLLSLTVTPALAADGDGCATAATDYDVLAKGRMVPVWCVAICDNNAASAACTTFDFSTVGGLPDPLARELHEVDINAAGGTDCTAGTFTFATSSDAGLATTDENVFALGASTAVAKGGTTKLLIDQKTAPLDRYLMTLSSVTCTLDGFDVLLIGYEERKQ